jgi:short-subunit dehydrogenase
MFGARQFAIVTGASTGIGLELAKCCAREGFDLLIAADEPEIDNAAVEIRKLGANVDGVQADLSTTEGVDRRVAAANGRPVDALLANAGRGLGRAFLDQDFKRARLVIDIALREELHGTKVTVTCLMPGATETRFFERADMMDTSVAVAKKDDAGDVARTGFDAMMRGDGDIVSGINNKIQSSIASITPAAMLARQHRKQAAPGSAKS